nr:hypothetical protein [Tanacetum cinerariifolium]
EQGTRGGISLPKMGTTATPGAKHDPCFGIPTGNVATIEVQDTCSTESVGSGKSTSSPSMVGSPRDIYQPRWGVTNNYRLDTPDACQDVIDHIVPLGYFSELRHMPNAEFLSQYNKNLVQQEFKKSEDDGVEKRYAEMDAHLDALSIHFDEELHPHMLIAIVGRRWAIGHDLCLAVMKCPESIELRKAFANVMMGRNQQLPPGHPDACQDVVDHIVPPGYFSELRHMPNAEFLSQYNKKLVQQVAMGSQLRLRFEQEVRLLKKARA